MDFFNQFCHIVCVYYVELLWLSNVVKPIALARLILILLDLIDVDCH